MEAAMAQLERAERLQIMLNEDELAAVENWRFERRMPSRAAAVRELLRRGLAADGFLTAGRQTSAFSARWVAERRLGRAAPPHKYCPACRRSIEGWGPEA